MLELAHRKGKTRIESNVSGHIAEVKEPTRVFFVVYRRMSSLTEEINKSDHAWVGEITTGWDVI